uniref:hypothetical protein n=1 Tax=Natronococcus sp. TaxID=35747 RepID=UPI0025DCC121
RRGDKGKNGKDKNGNGRRGDKDKNGKGRRDDRERKHGHGGKRDRHGKHGAPDPVTDTQGFIKHTMNKAMGRTGKHRRRSKK